MTEILTDTRTAAQRISDAVTLFCGSWHFIILFSSICCIWVMSSRTWDPYPFILLNLMLTIVSTFQSPLIMMSQNRQIDRDREAQERQAELDRELVQGVHVKLDTVLWLLRLRSTEITTIPDDNLAAGDPKWRK